MKRNEADVTALVSVIVPVYKVERYLERCVESIKRQTYGNLEIILVDDGSPDGCPELCDRLAGMDSRIRVIHKENAGLGYARNSGLEIAHGEWVLFVDSDDMIALNAVGYLMSLAQRYPDVDQIRFMSSDIMDDSEAGASEVEIEGNVTVLQDFPDKILPILGAIAPLNVRRYREVPSLASAWSAIYRREVVERYGVRFFSEREMISEDYIFNLDFAAVSRGIAYTPEKFYIYRVSPKSLTRTFKSDRIEKSAFLCGNIESRLDSMGFDQASEVAMGAMLVYVRAHHQHIFDSGLPARRKREYFYKVNANEMVERIAREFDFNHVDFKQRLAFAVRGSYYGALLFARSIDLLKHLAGR